VGAAAAIQEGTGSAGSHARASIEIETTQRGGVGAAAAIQDATSSAGSHVRASINKKTSSAGSHARAPAWLRLKAAL